MKTKFIILIFLIISCVFIFQIHRAYAAIAITTPQGTSVNTTLNVQGSIAGSIMSPGTCGAAPCPVRQILLPCNPKSIIYEGNLMNVQAMLGETKEDVENWIANNYCGVDMESATLFAVSSHFKVPSVALLYIADNLAKRELVTDKHYHELKKDRLKTRRENYKIALKTILDD